MDRIKIESSRWIVVYAFVFAVMASPAQTLEECVALALENNLEFQKQQLNPMLAQNDMAEKKSSNYGKLSVVSSYTHYNLPRTLAPLTPASILTDPMAVPTTEDLFNAGLVYELPLFTGFAQTHSVEISALQQEMAHAAVALNREQLVYNVKTLYVNILSLRSQEEAQSAYIEALQRLHDDITREMELGKKARIDQLKAAADLKSGQSKQTQLSADLAIMKNSLANLLNIDQIDQVHDIAHAPELMVDVSDGLTGLKRLQAVRLATEKDHRFVMKTQAARYPQLFLNASYGQNFGPNDDSNANSGDWQNQEVWQAGVILKWDIFNFGNTKSKIQKARIVERQSLYEQEQVEQELARALKEAVTRINVAVSEYHSAEEELALTRETETIEQVRFKQGSADTGDLLYAKARNQFAHSRFINAGYRYKTAQFHLDYLLEKGEDR